MVPRPPEWSSRAVLRVLDEQERREQWRNKTRILNKKLGDSLRAERDPEDGKFYTRFRDDHWSLNECTPIFHKAKYALTVGVGRLFARYTLLVYRHPWMFIIFPAAVCLLLGIGFLFRTVVTDHEKQYALPQSKAHDDARLYSNAFKDSQVRNELIYVIGSPGANLLDANFLNALWNFHISVLDLEVTSPGGTDGNKSSAGFSAAAGAPPPQQQQQGPASHEDPESARTLNASLSSLCLLDECGQSMQNDVADSFSKHPLQATPNGKPGAARPQTFGSGRLFGDRLWRNGEPPLWLAGGGPNAGGPLLPNLFPFRPLPPAPGAPPLLQLPPVPPPGGDPSPAPPRGEDNPNAPPCVEAAAPPKDRISGLACRLPVKPGHYAFSNLCWKDHAGVCTPPDGILFMYNNRGDFGQPVGYPRHTNWVLASEAPTDIWLSPKGLQLTAGGSQARATSGFALRYLLSDNPSQRAAAIEWEHALVRHINDAGGALPGASLYVKTEQSLAEDLSSTIDPTGHEDFIYVLIAALLIFLYLGLATFSTNRYRSKMLVALIGGLAAALGYCGGAGLCYLAGLQHTTTVTAAPFLVLGIGVDDVFVIINSYSLTYPRASARERLRITMRDSGLSITVTTLTNLISFAIGSTSPYLAIKNFCVFTAAGLFAGYLTCITLFLACLSIDARYEEKKRLDGICPRFSLGTRSLNGETTSTEASSGASAAPAPGAAASVAGALPAGAAPISGQQASSERGRAREQHTPVKADFTTAMDESGYRKRVSPHRLGKSKEEQQLKDLRQSLLDKHANTVYECVTLQVAMALTKGARGQSAPSKRFQSSRRRPEISLQQAHCHSAESRIRHGSPQVRTDQPQHAGKVHPLSKDPRALVNYSSSHVFVAPGRQQEDHEGSERWETYRSGKASRAAHEEWRWRHPHSVPQERHLRNGSFEGDLVLTHQLPVRTSSTSTPRVYRRENRRRRRISSARKGVLYNVRQARRYSRRNQAQNTQCVRLDKKKGSWNCERKLKTTTRAGSSSDIASKAQLTADEGGRQGSGDAHMRGARQKAILPHFTDAQPPAKHTSATISAGGRQKHTWRALENDAHRIQGKRNRQKPLCSPGARLTDTCVYDAHSLRNSEAPPQESTSGMRRHARTNSASARHDTFGVLQSRTHEQIGTDFSPICISGRRGASRYYGRPEKSHVNEPPKRIARHPLIKPKKTAYKRRPGQRASLRPAAPTRWVMTSADGSVALKRCQNDRRAYTSNRQGTNAESGMLEREKPKIYTRRKSHADLPSALSERNPVKLSASEGQKDGNDMVSRPPVGGLVDGHKKLETRATSAMGGKASIFLERRRDLQASTPTASPHDQAAESSASERAKNAGSDFHYRRRELAAAEEGSESSRESARSIKEKGVTCKRGRQPIKALSQSKRAESSAPWDAGKTLQPENANKPGHPPCRRDHHEARKTRKPTLLRRLFRRQGNKSYIDKGIGEAAAHPPDKLVPMVSRDSGKADSGGTSPNSTPRSPQSRRRELLRILKPEDLAEPPGNVGRRWRLLVLNHLGRIFITPVVKLTILVGFATMFAVAVIGCTKLKRGLDPRNLTRDGSSLKVPKNNVLQSDGKQSQEAIFSQGESELSKFLDAQEQYFPTYGDPVHIFFLKPQHPCSPSFRSEYAWFHNLLESRTYTKILVDGLDTFFRSPLGGLAPSDNLDACMQVFRSWLQTPIGSNFASQFTWRREGDLEAFQIQLVPQYYSGSQELSEFMTMLRDDLSKFKNASVHAYNKHFIFYESDSNVIFSTLSNMAWAVLAATMVSFALLPSLWSAALVIFILILIDVAIVGFMYYWNLPLNMLTMVNLIISIGFSIDYAAHMCHTFSHCVGLSRDMRVFETLVLIGNPIFHGVMSTQLGVLVLAHTCSYVLKVFFKMMTLVLTLAFAHGAILLPVLLSLFGPIGHEKEPLNVALSNFKRGLTMKRILSKKYPA